MGQGPRDLTPCRSFKPTRGELAVGFFAINFAHVHSPDLHHRLQRPGGLALAQTRDRAHPGASLIATVSEASVLNEHGTPCRCPGCPPGAKLEVPL